MESAGRLCHAAAPAGWTVTVVNPQDDRDAPAAPGEAPPGSGEGAHEAGARETAADTALVTACLAGRREAFDEIVTRHQRMVYRVCYRFAGNHADASDLAQDVFVRAYKGLGSFRGGSSLSTWLYRIAVNVSLNHVGSRRPLHDGLDQAGQIDAGVIPADENVWREQKAAKMRAAISQLPDRQRATVILRVYHDLTHEEIARVLGSSVGTVKANFFHALRNLKGLLGRPEGRR